MFKICVSWDDKLYKLLGPNPQVGNGSKCIRVCLNNTNNMLYDSEKTKEE